MDDARRQFVDRTFRARLSWTLLVGLGLLGLTREFGVGIRGGLLGLGIAGFVWLNQPLARWIAQARRRGDSNWQPMAIGMGLRLIALVAVVAVSW